MHAKIPREREFLQGKSSLMERRGVSELMQSVFQAELAAVEAMHTTLTAAMRAAQGELRAFTTT